MGPDHDFWWQLPGPRRFVGAVVRDLYAGRSVLLGLPAVGPPGLREAVAGRAHENAMWSWRELDLAAEPDAANPARLLHEQFCPVVTGGLPGARTLADADAFAGQVVWLSELTEALWPAWRRFVEEYAAACRARPENQRGLLVVACGGAVAESLPAERDGLAVRRWRGVADRLDVALFLADRLRDAAGLPLLQRKLAVAVGTELAGPDPDLARAL